MMHTDMVPRDQSDHNVNPCGVRCRAGGANFLKQIQSPDQQHIRTLAVCSNQASIFVNFTTITDDHCSTVMSLYVNERIAVSQVQKIALLKLSDLCRCSVKLSRLRIETCVLTYNLLAN